MVKPETVRARRGAQPPTLVHKNVTTSELLDQITSCCIAEQTMFLHRGCLHGLSSIAADSPQQRNTELRQTSALL